MFIKADTIIPHQYTFYDLIVTKAEGKSGTLFGKKSYRFSFLNFFQIFKKIKTTSKSRTLP